MPESAWIRQIFESKIAKRGGVVRRKMTSVQHYASLDELKKAAKRRGFHVLQHGDQWLVFCDKAQLKIIA